MESNPHLYQISSFKIKELSVCYWLWCRFINSTDTWSSLSTYSYVPFFAPVSTPWVFNQYKLYTICLIGSITNGKYAVVKVTSTFRSSNNTTCVLSENNLICFNCYRNRPQSNCIFQSILSYICVWDNTNHSLPLNIITLGWSMSGIRIRWLNLYRGCLCIFECVIHQSAKAWMISLCPRAIHQLLLW